VDLVPASRMCEVRGGAWSRQRAADTSVTPAGGRGGPHAAFCGADRPYLPSMPREVGPSRLRRGMALQARRPPVRVRAEAHPRRPVRRRSPSSLI
ncbi:MAG: hypothetical protein AVDCRST_MAG78-3362, partial [uncultured Rubrobacteraceae bacterium]